MIKETEGKNGNKIYVYQEPYENKKQDFFNTLINTFTDYAESNDIDISKVEFDFKLINEINIRVDKRRDYYIIFHKETYLNEVRESALIAFWVLKFKPFLIASEKGSDYNLNINCGFAAYIMLSSVSEYIDREFQSKKELYVTEEYLKKLNYALKYWDLSKEALMLIAETLCGSVKDKENGEDERPF